jgi:hypothetical protein
MTDEPENVDLRFLAEQGKRILDELAEARAERIEMRAKLGDAQSEMRAKLGEVQSEMRAKLGEVQSEQKNLAHLVGNVAAAVTAIATTQDHQGQILERHSVILEAMSEHDALTGGRLNAIEARLARIEKHTGLVKA